MVGGHLDSWASATGATDNGAGTDRGDGSHAHSEFATRAAATHHPHRTLDRRGTRRVWIVRVREAALWIRTALDRPGSAIFAGISSQAGRPCAS